MVHSIIPSLHTFLEDTKYLDPCAKIFKQLLPRNSTRSVYQEFSRMHDGRCTLREQQSERASKIVRHPSAKEAHSQAYLQLWLYAIRHFPEMTGHAPRKHLSRTKPNIPQVEYIWWNGITNLAKQCGFEDIVEAYPTVADADHRMAEEFLASVRPSPKFRISMDKTSNYVQQLVEIVRSVEDEDDSESSTPAPPLFSETRECGLDVSSRCGIPYEQSFQQDRKWFFLKNMSVDEKLGLSAHGKQYLTSFGVKKGMFQRFFIQELASDVVAGDSMIPQHDEEIHMPNGTAPGDDGGNARSDVPAPRNDGENPRSDGPAPGNNVGTPRPDATTEDVTMAQPSDQSAPPINQTSKRRRSTEESAQELNTTSTAAEPAVVPASYSLDIPQDFLIQANVDQIRARQIYHGHSNTDELIIVKAKSTTQFDVFSIPSARRQDIMNCLGDKQGKFFVSKCQGKRLRTVPPADIATKVQQPVLVVSSEDSNEVRTWFEEDPDDMIIQ